MRWTLFNPIGGAWEDAGVRHGAPQAGSSSDAHRHPRGLRRDARPREGRRLRLPGDQRHVVPDAQRGPARLRRGGERRHRPGLHGRRGVPVRLDRQGHGPRRAGPRGVRAPCRQGVRRHHRAAHRPLPEEQARRLHAPADRAVAGARRCRARAAVPVAHVGRLGRASSRRTSRSPRSCSSECAKARIIMEMEIGVVGGEEDGVAHEINEKLYTTPEDALRTAETHRHRREGPLPAGRDLRQRARRLQAGQRQAAPRDPQGAAGRGRREARQGQAVRPRLPRRLGLPARGDPRDARLRRREDERRHRHPVRVHAPGRRSTCSRTTTAC